MYGMAESYHNVHESLLLKICAGNVSPCKFGDISVHRLSRVSPWTFQTIHYQVMSGPERDVLLTEHEFCVLWLLVRARGGLLTPAEITYFLYEERDGDIPLTNTVQVFVSRLRKKAQRVASTVHIETFRRYGYQLVAR